MNDSRLTRTRQLLPLALLMIACHVTSAAAQSFTEFPIPIPAAQPFHITTGPDGNLWFAEYGTNKLVRMTPGGVFDEYDLPTPNSLPYDVTAGPDGNVWYTALADRVGKVTPAGVITEYVTPTSESGPQGITTGPDGNLWVALRNTTKVAKVTPDGTFTEYMIPFDGSPWDITAGPDGNLWFTELYSNKVSMITPDGAVTQYVVPTAGSQPLNITAGTDGNLWFTEKIGNKIGRVTTSGVFTEYSLPELDSQPFDIVSGPDGNLWFTESNNNKIGRLTPTGVMTEFTLPTDGSGPHGIASGPNQSIWFLERYARNVGQIAAVVPTPTATATATATPTTTPTPSAECGPAPLANCRKPIKPLRSMLLVKDRTPEAQDALAWQWTTGAATLKSEFGDPTATTRYSLCIYDRIAATPALVSATSLSAGGACAAGPCWRETSRGFRYVDGAGTSGGVVLLTLKEGFSGNAQIKLTAKGAAIDLPLLPLTQDPSITVQLKNDAGTCWDADYSGTALRNTQSEFRDKAD